ncbi:hypothetical protein DSUL_100008 [Desulfovibrionales bacterium]
MPIARPGYTVLMPCLVSATQTRPSDMRRILEQIQQCLLQI